MEKALSTIVGCADHPIAELNLLSDVDRKQIWSWNSLNQITTIDNCVHNLFVEQALRRPEAPAICAWDGELSYKMLHDLSSRLAYHLVELGVGAETIVPICFDKSVWTSVAMIAVLKAGGACVCLGPTQPLQRLETLIRSCNAALVIAANHHIDLFQNLPIQIVRIQSAESIPEKTTNLALPRVQPDHAAVIAFTSGSTGTPKGIVISHRALCSSIHAHGSAWSIGPTSRVFQFSAYTFDVSIADLFTTVTRGGCVCVPSEEERMDNIAEAIRRTNANWAFLTPTVAALVDPMDAPSLTTLVLGGERVQPENIQRWSAALDLIICYGPSECSIYSFGSQPVSMNSNPSNFGHAIGARGWITDPSDHNHLAPIGAVGELLIEGPLVARGYLNDPDRTAEMFVDNPTWRSGQETAYRLYKTGDLVRYSPDGSFEFVKRKDAQVKIHGQRVELTDIEHHIMAVSDLGLKKAIVEVVNPSVFAQSQQMLAAFLNIDILDETENVFPGPAVPMSKMLREKLLILRGSLVNILPSYMVPSVFIPLSKVPFTISGKLDRTALRRMAETELNLSQLIGYSLSSVSKRAPSTPMEHRLRWVWSQVLGLDAEDIGADSHFFRCGGDSVGAMRLVSAARDANILLTVGITFSFPQLSAMAKVAQDAIDSAELTAIPKPFSLLPGVDNESLNILLNTVAAQCGIEQSQIEDLYPCTSLQEGLIAISTAQPGTYVSQMAFRLPPTMEVDRFCQAWEKAVEKHAILRTRIVHTARYGSLQVVLREKILWETGSNLGTYLQADRSTVLSHGSPLARYCLITEPDGRDSGANRFFIWTAHHALYDGWSRNLILAQVEQIFRYGSAPTLSPFSRFIAYLSEADKEATAQYWGAQLSGNHPVSFPQSSSTVYQPRTDQRVKQSLVVSRPQGATITTSTILRAAWALLLTCYCNSGDIIFGAPMSGRNAPVYGIDQIVGPTITTVPIRISIDRGQTIAEFLRAVQQQATDMIPFEQTGLQNIHRLTSQEVTTDLKNLLIIQPLMESTNTEFLGLENVPLEVNGFDSYALVLECVVQEKGIVEIEARYDSSVLPHLQMQLLTSHFAQLVQQLSDQSSHLPLSQVDMFSETDRQQIWQWSQQPPEMLELCVHEQFATQVLSQPHSQAVCSWDGNLSYRELDDLSWRLASYISRLGVGAEVVVPLCFDKSLWTIVAMMSVLKAGGACAALNPAHPKQRLQHIITETSASVLLVSPQHYHLFADAVPNLVSHVVKIDQSLLNSLPHAESSPSIKTQPSQLAFVTFTSGSTGQPKGILVEHRAVCTSLYAHTSEMGFNASTRVLQFAAYTFDVCLTEIFGTLLHGGCICVPEETERINDLSGAINRLRVNSALLTPTVAGLIYPADVPRLQTLTLGGEALTQALVERWAAHVCLINIYGVTECSIWAAAHTLRPDRKGQINTASDKAPISAPSTIGQGLGASLWIVDAEDYNRLAPVGSVGELLIGGPIIARGYLNNPEKTAAAFIQKPSWLLKAQEAKAFIQEPAWLSDATASRLYRTGDLVRYNTDGTIYYLGRRDAQVKVHGQRIELGEIEHHIMAYSFPGLKQPAVEVVTPTAPATADKQQLVAFLHLDRPDIDVNESSTDGIISISDDFQRELLALQMSLTEVLPLYMVPSAFIPLSSVPTTTSGKLDRRALRELVRDLDTSRLSRCSLADVNKRPTSTEMEKKLQRVWTQVLSVENVGADDHFFRSGGDSVGAMRLVAAALESKIILTVAMIFSHPQLSAMALAAQESQNSANAIVVPEPFSLLSGDMSRDGVIEAAVSQCGIEKHQVEDIYPCTALQEGLVAISSTQPGAYVTQLVYRMPPAFAIDHFREAWEKVREIHPILRTRVIHTLSHGTLQVVVRDSINWSTAGTDLDGYLSSNSQMKITHGGLLARYAITEQSNGIRHFVWTIHHALYDGWTMRLVLAQVEQIFLHGVQDSIPRPPPFSCFIAYTNHVDEEAATNFWSSQFRGRRPSSFPQATPKNYRPRPDQSERLSMVILHPADTNTTISTITLSTILRAAWALLLSRYCDAEDVVFGAPLSGRNATVVGIDRMLGPTLTTVPVKITVDRRQSVADFLHAIQHQATEMIPFEQTGIQNIRRLPLVPQGAVDFQNLLVVQPRVGSEQQPSKFLGLEPVPIDAKGFDTYGLILECDVMEGQVDVEARYDSSLLSVEQSKRMLHHFETAIRQLCATRSEQLLLSEISISGQNDRQQILQWNSLSPEVIDRCVHEVFVGQALQQPDAPAVFAWDGKLTFKGLDELSSQVAQHLVTKLKVGPETKVPLCFDKSLWMTVAMLGVMKAGGVCVCLGPTQPIQRLVSIVEQCNASLVIAASRHVKLCQALPAEVLDISNIAQPTTFKHSGYGSFVTATPENTALIQFTSGTTGTPKGITITHKAICSSMHAHGAKWHIGPGTRVFQYAAYTFDVSFADMFTTLTQGGCVCIPSEDDRLNNIAGAIRKLNANWAFLTPTVAGLVDPHEVPSLKTLVLGGEAATAESLRRWASIELISSYGPAECSIHSFGTLPVDADSDPADIGYCIGGNGWIVDYQDHNRLTPVGGIGELLIEGPILAEGYLGDSEKTRTSFIENPAWTLEETENKSPNEALNGHNSVRRFYKTGDLVRYTATGSLRFVGRKDTQVKLHGQRIELSEIEHHLSLDSHVQNSVVLMPAKGPFEKQLLAVIVLKGFDTDNLDENVLKLLDKKVAGQLMIGQSSASNQLVKIHERLSDYLPGYFMPAAWAVVCAHPMNASGKLDRARITQWAEDMDDELHQQILDLVCETPDTPVSMAEEQLQAIWSRALGIPVPGIGLNRPFTSVGGDSITAMQVRAHCRAVGIALTVEDILRSKSITQLAALVESVDRQQLTKETPNTPFRLSPIQQLYFSRIIPSTATRADDHDFAQKWLLRLTKPVSIDNVAHAVRAVISRHSMLRAVFRQEVDGTWTQHIKGDLEGSYTYEALTVEDENQIPSITAACQASLDIINGPVFVANSYSTPGGSQFLFLAAHHLVVDLMSWRIILSDLEEYFEAGNVKEAPLSFQVWCQTQEAYCRNLRPETLLPFEVTPADFNYWGMAGQPNVFGDVLVENITLDEYSTSMLFGSSNTSLRTEPLDIILAALFMSFNEVFPDRSSAPTIFYEGHGRESWDRNVDVSETVGWFTTITPLYISASHLGDNIVEAVRRTKDTRRKIPKHGWPYFASSILGQATAVERNSKFDQFAKMEILFNYLGRSQQLEREDALFRLENGSLAAAAKMQRSSLFEISVSVQDLTYLTFAFNCRMLHQQRIREWLGSYAVLLKTAANSLAGRPAEHTLSDFPLLPLTYRGLDKLKQELASVKLSVDEVEDIYACSPIQQGLLFSQIRSPETYRVMHVCEVLPAQKGIPVHARQLQKAWQLVVDRHSLLRTIFLEVESERQQSIFGQVVLKRLTASVHLLQHHGDDAVAFLQQQPPCEYIKGRPHHQFTICEMPCGRVFFKIEISHTLTDGTSMVVLMRDVNLAFQGQLPLCPAPLYADFISHLQQQDTKASLEYWRSYLNDVQPCRMPILSNHGNKYDDHQTIPISIGDNVQELRKFCADHGVTIANIFQAAWTMVLQSYSGSRDVCFGYLTSGRDVPIDNIYDAVGPFINMLVCRPAISTGGTSVLQLVKKIQDDMLRGLQHQHTPLVDIQHALGIGAGGLFNTAISLQRELSQPLEDQPMEGITLEKLVNHDPTEYDVMINVGFDDQTVDVQLAYCTTTIGSRQALQIASTLEKALSVVMNHPHQAVGELDLLSDMDRNQIWQWNKISPEPVEECVHELFSEQAIQHPDAPAICGWDGDLSYFELDDLSSRLAHKLAGYGVGPEVIVPLCFDKSTWTLVAMMSVLKAGGACAALNPAHPQQRLHQLARQANATVVLVGPPHAYIFNNVIQHVISVDRGILQELTSVEFEPKVKSKPTNAGFVVFTSGSTGLPKGIILEHTALCTSIYAHGAAMRYEPTSRVLQFSAYTYDNCLWEIFTTLLHGGCVVVPSDEQRLNNITAFMVDNRVTLATLTPTVVKMLSPGDLPMLETLAVTGEAGNDHIVQLWADKVFLFNSYGPAECTFCTGVQLQDYPGSAFNIGYGLGATLWIVVPTDHNKLSPIGSVGELLIEGPVVMRGYLGDPEKTTGAFIEDPLWLPKGKTGSRRLYKTGDLVRYNEDGTMYYLGRKDTQVKLHGQRIELAEVEHHVLASNLAGLQLAAVDVITPAFAKTQQLLAAFLYLNLPGTGEDLEMLIPMSESLLKDLLSLQRSLSNVLPLHMVPSMFIPLARMPKTTSQKIDRKSLRQFAAEFSSSQLAQYSLANLSRRTPSTLMETRLQAVWSNVLGIPVDAIGADDHFFRIGGDSVAAMRLVAAARDTDIVITVAIIFKSPELSAMALVAQDSTNSQELSTNPEPLSLLHSDINTDRMLELAAAQCGISREQIEDVYPSTSLQEGLMAISITQPGTYVSREIYRLPAENIMPFEKFQDAWGRVFQANSILRTRIIHTVSHGTLQVVIKESIRWQTGSNLEEYLQTDQLNVVHGGELTRYALIRDQQGDRYFIWTTHHALYDGWSKGLILSQVQQMFVQGDIAQTTPFSRFIAYLTNTERDQDSATKYWSAQLSGNTPASFPSAATPQSRPDQQQRRTAMISRQHGSSVTLSTVIRAAWAIVLSHYCDSDDIIFGAPLSGRNAAVAGIHEIVGPTLTTVPIKMSLDHSQTVTEFLAAVQQQAVEMIPFEHTGLQKITRLSKASETALAIKNLLIIQPLVEPTQPRDSTTQHPSFLGLEALPADPRGFDSYPLVMECGLLEDGRMEIDARYDSSILSLRQMKRLLDHFEQTIHQISQEPPMTVGEVNLFSDTDRQQISQWNSSTHSVVEACVHGLFMEEAAKRPDALAVCGWDEQFTYKELNELSSRLAIYLREDLGVGPEIIVPFCFDKSAWTILAILAIMKAGGACAPLNPEHPKQRLQQIITQTQASLVLVSPQHETLFNDALSCVVKVGQDLLTTLEPGGQFPETQPSQAAFVVFTSGSTGQPKGIVLEHRALCSSMYAHGAAMSFTPATRMLQFAAYTFDASLTEIFTTLLHGGCVCVPHADERVNDLSGAINRLEVNMALLTPTVAALIHPQETPQLKALSLGGEALTQAVVERWADSVRMINIYGPAECSIWAAGQIGLTRESVAGTIGQGIGATLWITDPRDHNRLTPIGCVGELLIEGPVLARGYLNEPSKTAAAFIENPAWLPTTETRRLYKTGDLARYNEDGSIYYIGRRDTQIKLNGQRIELGDIEYQINMADALTGLHLVAVEVVSTESAQPLLAAFLHLEFPGNTTETGPMLPISDTLQEELKALQARLINTMPAYMVPSLFIPLSQMPTTTSGKLDRRGLKELAARLKLLDLLNCALTSVAKRAPSTVKEKKLQAVWAAVLGVAQNSIGADANFFHQGGDSVAAMRLVAVAKLHGVVLSVAQIFGQPILADQAETARLASINGSNTKAAYQAFSLLGTHDIDSFVTEVTHLYPYLAGKAVQDVVPATDFQSLAITGSVVRSRWMIPYFDFIGSKALDLERLKQRCIQMVKSHSIFRTVFVHAHKRYLQVILEDEKPDFRYYETDQDLSEFVDQWRTQDRNVGVQLGRPFLCFMVVKSKASNNHRIVVRISHAQYDGISLPQIWTSLFGPDEATLRCSDFSNYVAAGMKTEESFEHWRKLLLDSAMTGIGDSDTVIFGSPAMTNTWKSKLTVPKSKLGEVTVATLVKAAWSFTLAKSQSSTDVVFGNVVACRNGSEDLYNIVGPCLNILPIRVILDAEWRVIDLLRYVQNQQLANMKHETLGFRDIIQNCTAWPNWTRFSSIVQHENVNTATQKQLEEMPYTLEADDTPIEMTDVFVFTVSMGDELEIYLSCPTGAVNRALGQNLHSMLCGLISSWSTHQLTFLKESASHSIEQSETVVSKVRTANDTSAMTMTMQKKEAKEVRAIIKSAWAQILGDETVLDDNSSFFDLGGDIIAVGQLVPLLRREGLHICFEDAIECPTINSLTSHLVAAVAS